MTELIHGIHHITALASHPQTNVDFYAGILGLRLVKKTVNYDAPDVYHLYYGNETGSPGTILTFFVFPGISQGRKGKGQLTTISFSIRKQSLSYWINRLKKFNVNYSEPKNTFNGNSIYFEDFDGLGLELVPNNDDNRPAFTYGNIPAEHAIRGFYGITLSEECDEKTAKLLVTQMNHKLIEKKDYCSRYTSTGMPGGFVDIVCHPETLRGTPGYGTVHHVAFATENDSTQLEARSNLIKYGLNTTPVIDRQYFHSIYFREPGGVLFEIATLPPGFTVDERLDELGENLQLPPWEESHRAQIEKNLIPFQLDLNKFAD